MAADPARPTDYRSRILTIDPPLPAGARLAVVGGDAFLELSVPRGTTAEVPDYDQGDDEPAPYLRVLADGTVERNRRAAATVLNASRYGTSTGDLDLGGTPSWEVVAHDGTYAWHDHRIHWMLPTPPAEVGADGRVELDGPDGTWQVTLVVDGTTHLVTGELLLLDPPSPAWWSVVAVGGGAALLLGGVGRRRRPVALAAALAALAAAAVAVGIAAYRAAPAEAGASPISLAVPAVGAAAALVAATRPGRARRAGLAAVAAALGSWAWLRRAVIDHAVLPTTWPPALDRTVTALALGAAAATVVLLVWRPPGTVRASRPDGTVGTAPPPPGP